MTRKDVGGYASGELACDGPARRIYAGNSVHGYFEALTADGRRLWRADIPGFQSVAADIEDALEPNAEFLMEALDHGGSLFEKLSVSGPHVIAEYRTGDLQFHAIYHRSGALLTVLGPWNGVLKRTVPGGWRFYWARSKEPGAYFFPDGELDISVDDDVADPLVEYLLASVTPTRSGVRLEWSMCPGGAADLGEMVPGPWRPALAKKAINTRNRLGPEWIEELAARMEASGIDDPRDALLAVGADVELMAAATAESAGGP